MTMLSSEVTPVASELDASDLLLLHVLSDVRLQAREEHGTSDIAGWAQALDASVLLAVRSGRADDATRILQERLGLSRTPA